MPMNNMRPISLGLKLAIALLMSVPAHADDWPMFGRSRTRNSVSPEKNPPVSWSVADGDAVKAASKNVIWTSVMGSGSSYYGTFGDPVIVGGRIWIGTNTDYKSSRYYALNCLDAKTGKLLYQHRTPFQPQIGFERFLHTMGTSPVIEANRIWFFTNRAEVVCLDLAPLNADRGEPREIWKVDTRKDLGVYRTKSIFDCRFCSVAVHGDLLFVITGNGVNYWDQDGKVNAAAPSLVCFNKNTGKIIWSDNSPGKDILHSQFASPTVISVNGKTQVVAPQGDGWVRSFEAATGKLIWKFDTNPSNSKWDRGRGDRNYLPATAVFHDNRIFIGNGQEPEMRGGLAFLYSIDATKNGDISPHVADGSGKLRANPDSGMIWKYGGMDAKTKSRVFSRTLSNVAIDNGLLIAADISGTIHCLDERTGQAYWTHDTKSSIQGSPLIADGKVFVGDDDGTLWILKLSKEKAIVNQIEMGGWIRASPVYANGVLYIASGHTLFAIAGAAKDAKK